MIRFSCPECDTGLKTGDEKAGTKILCPECGEQVLVPSAPRSKGGSNEAGKGGTISRRGGGKDAAESAKSQKGLYIGLAVGACVLVAGGGIYFGMNYLNNDKSDSKTAANNTSSTTPPPAPAPTVTPQVPAPTPAPTATNAPAPSTPLTPSIPKTAETSPFPKPPETKPETKPAETKVADAGSEPKAPAETYAVNENADKIYQRVLKSTCWVVTYIPGKTGPFAALLSGSGSLVDRVNRLVLTNYHVISEANKPEAERICFFPQYEKGKLIKEREAYQKMIQRKERGIPYWVVISDKKRDLALIQLTAVPDDVQVLPLAATTPSVGTRVHSLGSPGRSGALFGYVPGTVRNTYLKKWTSVGGREAIVNEAQVIETDSATNEGDSGGPLVNDRKELVGVTQSYALGARQISTFIDISEVRAVLNKYYKEHNLKALPEAAPTATNDDVPTLVRALEDREATRRIWAAQKLATMGPEAKPAVPRLVKVLKDKDDNVRRNVAEALAQMGSVSREYLPEVTEALKDPNSDVRVAVLATIRNMGPEADKAVPALVRLLKEDKETQVRQKAALTLGHLGNLAKDAVPALAAALKDESVLVRAEAAAALAQMGNLALPALENLGESLKDNQQDVRVNALKALEALGPDAKPLLPQIKEMLMLRDRDTRLQAIAVVGAIGPDAGELAPTLVSLLDREEFHNPVGDAVVRIGKAAVTPLITALKHPKWEVRKGAAHALGQMGSDARRAVQPLTLLSRSDVNAEVKKEATAALKRITGK